MRTHRLATDAEVEAVTAAALAAVDAAVEFARQSPFPAAAALHDGVFADDGSCAT
jgi:TPP-dependent pyruvate/acetoin dehydrogenase alpha subunit